MSGVGAEKARGRERNVSSISDEVQTFRKGNESADGRGRRFLSIQPGRTSDPARHAAVFPGKVVLLLPSRRCRCHVSVTFAEEKLDSAATSSNFFAFAEKEIGEGRLISSRRASAQKIALLSLEG